MIKLSLSNLIDKARDSAEFKLTKAVSNYIDKPLAEKLKYQQEAMKRARQFHRFDTVIKLRKH